MKMLQARPKYFHRKTQRCTVPDIISGTVSIQIPTMYRQKWFVQRNVVDSHTFLFGIMSILRITSRTPTVVYMVINLHTSI